MLTANLSMEVTAMHKLIIAFVAAVALAGSPAAHACAFHGPASASVGMLNCAHREALHERAAVSMALLESPITTREARAQGLDKKHGSSESVERASAMLDRSFQLKENPMSQTKLSMEVQ